MIEPEQKQPELPPSEDAPEISSAALSEPDCPACQAAKDSGAKFCSQCGRRVALAIQTDDQAKPKIPTKVPANSSASPATAASQTLARPGRVVQQANDSVGAMPEAAEVATPAGQDIELCPHCGQVVQPSGAESYCLSYQTKDHETSSVVLVGKQLTIGKAPECDLVITTDEYVSRRHARLVARDGKYFLEDLESSNGTFIRVRRPMELQLGDEILVGTHSLEFNRTGKRQGV